MEMDARTRIVVIKQPCLLRQVLIERLVQERDLSLVGVCAHLKSAVMWIRNHKPHVVVVDLSFEKALGLIFIRTLKKKFSDTGVVACACNLLVSDMYTRLTQKAGADALVVTSDGLDGLIDAIRCVNLGRGDTNGPEQVLRKGRDGQGNIFQ